MRAKLHRRLAILVLLHIAFILSPQIVNACACLGGTTVLDEYKTSDEVVIARLISTQKVVEPNNTDLDHIQSFTMEVEKVFKGSLRVQERLVIQQGNGIDCLWRRYDQDIDSKALLYLKRPEKAEYQWYVWGCGRSRQLSNADDDLLYLNHMNEARGRTRVSGTLREIKIGGDESLEGRKIRIIGSNRTYVATTDKNGVYELYDLPPGRYALEPELTYGWEVEDFYLTRKHTRRDLIDRPTTRVEFTLQPKRHFGIDITLRLSNHISGVVHDSTSKPMEGVCVSLVPTDNERPVTCNELTHQLGRFRFESVAAGTYTIILNCKNEKTSLMPFPTLYYPGVTEKEKATTITVKHGESLDGLNIAISQLYETIKLEGVVRYADGRPAAGMRIGFKTTNRAEKEGDIDEFTDAAGQFSLTVLKGLKGELYGTFPPWRNNELARCATLGTLVKQSGTDQVVLETPHLPIFATEDKLGLVLKFPASPCAQK